MGGEAGQSVPVGNIKITDIDLVGTNGNYTFTKTANIKIEAGDKEGIASDAWMGPIISGTSGIPVTLKGTITGRYQVGYYYTFHEYEYSSSVFWSKEVIFRK